MTNLLITGSLAYDRISVFEGKFHDHILPHKIHELSVVFSVEEMRVDYGGTAGNLAYNLNLFEEKSIVFGCLGKDGQDYFDYFKELGLSTDYIKKSSKHLTATATIMTDLESNQITSFYVGAMAETAHMDLNVVQEEIYMAIIAPNDIPAMLQTREYCLQKKIPFIADPGQRTPVFKDDELKTFIKDSFALIVNDYELELVKKQINWDQKEILKYTQFLIVTYGAEGSKIYGKNDLKIGIPAYSPKQVVDPTGAGDAYRGGLLFGLKNNHSIEKSAHFGAWLASKCIEEKGAQNHHLDKTEFEKFMQSL